MINRKRRKLNQIRDMDKKNRKRYTRHKWKIERKEGKKKEQEKSKANEKQSERECVCV